MIGVDFSINTYDLFNNAANIYVQNFCFKYSNMYSTVIFILPPYCILFYFNSINLACNNNEHDKC